MFFSVIIPLYNKASYIENAIKSVWKQDYNDYELIVINDGSVDCSLQVVENMQLKYPQKPLKIFTQENRGVSAARNLGVEHSKGDYICFLDADDWWEVNFLQAMRDFINLYPHAGIYATNYFYVKNHKKTVRVDIPTGYINYFKEYSKNLQMPLTSISVAVPKEIFKLVSGFKTFLKLGEDFDLWVRIAMQHKVAFLNRPLANYNQDVDVKNRGTRRLQLPEHHMLWHLEDFELLEKENNDYKELIDKLRVNSLMPYYLSNRFHQDAVVELQKVNWKSQPHSIVREYKKPYLYLRFKYFFLKFGSKVKQYILSKIK